MLIGRLIIFLSANHPCSSCVSRSAIAPVSIKRRNIVPKLINNITPRAKELLLKDGRKKSGGIKIIQIVLEADSSCFIFSIPTAFITTPKIPVKV